MGRDRTCTAAQLTQICNEGKLEGAENRVRARVSVRAPLKDGTSASAAENRLRPLVFLCRLGKQRQVN